jgi:mono/diheme cytochrome c family protein
MERGERAVAAMLGVPTADPLSPKQVGLIWASVYAAGVMEHLADLDAAGLAIGAGVSMLHNGLSARATPTALEAMLARNARHLAIPANARNEHNPATPSDQNLQEAMAHFADHCATCHGNDGSGDTLYGRGLYPKPPDLRLPETQKLSDGELYWIIENGVRFTGMAAFGGVHRLHDSWKLVLFIRHLPQLTTEERVEMERYNRKGPWKQKEGQEE